MASGLLQRLLPAVCDTQGAPLGGARGAPGCAGDLRCLCNAAGTRQPAGECDRFITPSVYRPLVITRQDGKNLCSHEFPKQLLFFGAAIEQF